ncbi:MAG: GAF domain-containing protein [bacterium]|nr:GAF domain-containing protein [bacterium]
MDAAPLALVPSAGSAGRPHAPEERLDPALGTLVRSLGATGGAVCLFGWGEATLRLAAEVGLSDEGCRILRIMRAGDGGWDAALACLRDRRPRVVVASDEAPLPVLVPDGEPAGAIACLPLVVDGRPLAVVLLVGADADTFADAALVGGGERLAVIARLVETIHHRARAGQRRRRTTPALLDTIAEQALRGVAPVVAEVGRLLEWARALPGVGAVADQLATRCGARAPRAPAPRALRARRSRTPAPATSARAPPSTPRAPSRPSAGASALAAEPAASRSGLGHRRRDRRRSSPARRSTARRPGAPPR